MAFLSCRMTFPADTCTVTVLTPSREKVQATLPSRVMTGCWGVGQAGGRVEQKRGPHHAAVIYMYVSEMLHTHRQTQTNGRGERRLAAARTAARSAGGRQRVPDVPAAASCHYSRLHSLLQQQLYEASATAVTMAAALQHNDESPNNKSPITHS